jgi:hypothetical protein
MSLASGSASFRYSPVRFVRNEKVSLFDKLILAFDALALNGFSGNSPGSGKLICGSQYKIVTVPLAKVLETVRHSVIQVMKQQKAECSRHWSSINIVQNANSVRTAVESSLRRTTSVSWRI